MTWLERPPKYSVLNCKRTPSLADQSREAAPGEPTRGHTQFASLTHTFESLSPALRQMLEGLNAVHANPGTNPNHASRHNTEIPPEQIHPCVRYHEGTGRKSLYINPVTKRAQAFNYPYFPRFFSIFSRFPRDFWPCSLDSWRPDAENGRKMGENG